MKSLSHLPVLIALIGLSLTTAFCDDPPAVETQPLPNEFTDAATGHRVLRLSRLPGASENQYFNQNAYTAQGDFTIITNIDPKGVRRIYSVNLKTLELRKLTDQDTSHWYMPEVAPKTRKVYYMRADGALCGTHLDTLETTVVAKLPPAWRQGKGLTINADETLLAGCVAIGEWEIIKKYPDKQKMVTAVHEAKLHNILYTVSIATGEIKILRESNTIWYDHPRFSPTDPALLMFCHEGPWEAVNRIWTIRTDGSDERLAVKRAFPNEAIGHEFWGPDGKMLWYDSHRFPERVENYIAGVDIATEKTTRYRIPGALWCIHYNLSPDRTFFVGDGWRRPGGGVENEENDWIYKLTPSGESLIAEKLFCLTKQNFKLEPNVSVTPDNQWVVFQSNISGNSQVYAVEVQRKTPSSKR